MNILGVDIGGSGIKGAPVDTKTGKLLAERHRIPTPQPVTPKAVAKTLNKLVQHFEWSGPIGCGFPAVVQKGVVRTAANIDESWVGVNAAALFSEVTGCPTSVINDADAAGLAEMQFGAGRGKSGVIILITVGTGLGTAAFFDGMLLPNTEFGHVPMNKKIAEHYASDAVRKRKNLSWKKWARRFDEYLQLLDRLLTPDLFIIGGGASKKHDKFLRYFTVETEVVPAQLRNEAGIIGAALAARTPAPTAKKSRSTKRNPDKPKVEKPKSQSSGKLQTAKAEEPSAEEVN